MKIKKILLKIHRNTIAIPKLVFGIGYKQYDQIIPGEINNDDFSEYIKEIATNRTNKLFVEIGSSAGGGSTKQFIESLLKREDKGLCKLICFEASEPRSMNLKNTYGQHEFVYIYNQSSIKLNEYPNYKDVTAFYLKTKSNLNRYGLIVVLSWLRLELKYLRKKSLGVNSGLEIMQKDFGSNIDVLLIDGSEFTGEVEFRYLKSAKYVLLDDVNSFKNLRNYLNLSNSKDHQIIAVNKSLRNGYAIFRRN
jgi:hypothetical protein